jgi:DUF1009 family protein
MTQETIGLIAGNGTFPLLFGRTAREEGRHVVAVAHEGESDPRIESCVDDLTWIKVGQLDTMVDTFRAHGVVRAVMAGGINKASLMEHFAPDQRGQRLLARLTQWSDDALLREVAAELEGEGIEIVDSTLFLSSILTRAGVLAGNEPSEQQWRDVRYGLAVARGVGRFDIGQTVVVKSGIVLAVEAIEGTDEALRRGGALGRGEAVAVKISKPGQDLRFDVPAVGRETIDTCNTARIAVLALEAEKTLILERDEFVSAARRSGLVVVGVRADGE